jgi:hypothetical protein
VPTAASKHIDERQLDPTKFAVCEKDSLRSIRSAGRFSERVIGTRSSGLLADTFFDVRSKLQNWSGGVNTITFSQSPLVEGECP